MARPFIVTGDQIDQEGFVVSGSTRTDFDGKPVARTREMVPCSRHRATTIASGAPGIGIDPNQATRHGDRIADGGPLISAQVGTCVG